MSFFNWSRTAASNAIADPTVNWAEGQAPSSVNDSARAMMASTAAFRDDIAGAIVTAGTSTAYTVTSYQVFSSLSAMDGKVIAFSPHTTCGSTVTLNVDSLGAKPLRSAPSADITAGTLIQGTPYTATYNNSDGAFYLHGFYGNPYNIPLGGMMDYVGSTAPNTSFVIPIGQAISRTTYAALFSLVSTTYGPGDGSTTFNVPDLTGRIVAMKESSATRLTSTYFGGNSTTLGAVGGLESNTLITGNLPAYTPAGSIVSTSTTTVGITRFSLSAGTTQTDVPAGQGADGNSTTAVPTTTVSAFTGTAQGGTSTPLRTVQPTIILNKILRVL